MIWNMRKRRRKKVFTVTLSGTFHEKKYVSDPEAALYVTINGTIYTAAGAYEVAPNTVISIFAQNFNVSMHRESAGTILLNGTQVNQSANYNLKITGNAVINGSVKNTGTSRTASASITMPA